jgi:pyruvate dehydrogenase (quinone)/pyruvate oxidase
VNTLIEEVDAMPTAADVLVKTLLAWGVDTVFGLPGDGINGLMEALRRQKKRIRFVHVRHEESAAFMACAHAKFTGRLGVCIATSGPGAIHLLNGLYDAKLDGQPVLALTGCTYHDLMHTMTQQDVVLDRLFDDVSAYDARVMGPAHVANVTHLACRTALARRGVAHVTIPVDVQSMKIKVDQPSERNVPEHANERFAAPRTAPDPSELDRAAAILDAGQKIAILAGQGALGATDELLAVAEVLGAPIAKALLGKGCVPDDHPLTTGGIGLLGTAPSQDALEACDTLLVVGSSFPYLEYYPRPGQAKCVQIDLDPVRIGLRYPVDAALVGDAGIALRQLLPKLAPHEDRSFLAKAQEDMVAWRALMVERGTVAEKPMKPQVVAHALGQRLRSDAVVISDSGTSATWFGRHIPAQRGQLYSLSGTLASMANGVPYAIAAQCAYPDRQVVALVGDGAFSMLLGEFATAVQYGLPIKVVVLRNDSLGMIKWEQMVFLGNPEYGCELHPIDFAAVARAMGATGLSCDDPAEIGGVLDTALATPGPVVVEAVVDPFEPPMPPRITPKQAAKFARSLMRGEPNRGRIALTVLADKVRETT